MFRPKSSRYESRRMSIKHRNSLDSSDNLSDQLLHKRSNSLQSLNSVDNQINIEERTKLAAKPRKIAWASRTCSEDNSYEDSTAATNAWNSCEIIDRLEPCIEYKNKLQQEESKKKSIDIFLSRNFIDPIDMLPSHRNPKLDLLRSFGSSSFATVVGKLDTDSSHNLFTSSPDESVSVDAKCEKKVTFAADSSKPPNSNVNSAETRRMNFRNSYSKRYTTNFSFSSPRLERQTSVSKCATPKAELRSTMKRGNSLSLAESADESTTATINMCRTTSPSSISPPLPSPSPLFKQSVLPMNQQQTEKMKQLTIKRKLKSCRSRSFHKSLDSSSIIENVETFTFAKPLKSTQNSDVVTMVSLIVSNEEDAPSTARPQPSARSDTAANAKENVDSKSEKQNKTGILKSRWQSENIKRASAKSMQKRRFINVSQEMVNSPEKNRTILTAVDNLIQVEKAPLDASTSSDSTYRQKNYTENDGKKSEADKSFQSAKEQECWSSFRKMTNKGFSVSFDTILRGLLTPTEYRLRKNELSTQESFCE